MGAGNKDWVENILAPKSVNAPPTPKAVRNLLPDIIISAARVLADSYTNITIYIYADNTLYHTQTVTNKSPFRLPRNGRYRVWQIEITGTDNVREIMIGETVLELQT